MRKTKRYVRCIYFFTLGIAITFSNIAQSQSNQPTQNLAPMLDTIRYTEQTPIRMRDSLISIYGADSKEAAKYQKQYRENHSVNIQKIKAILENNNWPSPEMIGPRGNLTICNVLQHADQKTRESFLPLMRQAVLENKLEASFLVRAEDRIRTDKGELQLYGGQMKYYSDTKTFNVWPVYDPLNIDKRRSEIGLEPIAEHLKNRFDFIWDLEEQIKRTEEFEIERKKNLSEN